MMTTWKSPTAITAGALLVLVASCALAGDLPTQVQNVWSPVGDVVGTRNHWAAGFNVLDQYGSESKSLEDWQLGEQYSGYGLFSYGRQIGTERYLNLRGTGTNEDGEDMTGRFVLDFGCYGKRHVTLKHRGYNYFGDATSEIRAYGYAAGAAPVGLDETPSLAWCRNDADLRYHVTDYLDLKLGLTRSVRQGDKASLLRDGTTTTVPGLKIFDTELMEFRWGGDAAYGPIAAALDMSYRTAEGDRALDTRQATTDDQTLFTSRLGATYDIAPDTRILGHFVNAKLQSDPTEVVGGVTYTPKNESTTNAGGLAVIRRLGTHALVDASARFKKTATTADDIAADTEQLYRDKDRKSQDYRLGLRYNGLTRTKLQAHYRYRSSNLTETATAYADYVSDLGGVTLAESGDTQVAEVDKTRQEFGAKARYRFNKKATLKAQLDWSSEDVEQTVTWDSAADEPWFFWMGDRQTTRLNWRLALQTRPAKDLGLDLGYQMNNRDFELQNDSPTETKWKTHRGFAAATWRLHERVTAYANASLGKDKSELVDGPETAGSLSPVAYDGTTWRYAPGAVLQLTSKMQFEAQFEGVDFSDDGDDPDGLNQLNTDYYRTTLRLRYRVLEQAAATFSYRRLEFDENRWDDTINDLYTLSLSGTF